MLFTSSNLDENKKYAELWLKVEKFENDGLPKSALEVVNQIYTLAKSENNSPQIIKAVIHKLKFKEQTEDHVFMELLKEVDSQIEQNEFPATNLLHYIKGNLYWQYYQNNRWNILDNKTTQDSNTDDVSNWSPEKFIVKSSTHYLKSLEQENRLKQIPVQDFHDILVTGNSENLRPTLYDFLIFETIEFFSDQEISLVKAADQFSINNSNYFLPAKEFSDISIITKDTLSFQYKVVQLYQQLLHFRLNENNKNALLHADLERLKFIYSKAIMKEKDELFITQLENLKDEFNAIDDVSDVYYELAQIYRYKASLYDQSDENLKTYRWMNVKALEYINAAKEKFKDADGTKRCLNLENEITRPFLNLISEEVYLPNTAFPVRIEFQNIKKSSLHIYKTSFHQLKND